MSRHEAGTFPRIEDQRRALMLVSMPVCVSVENEIEVFGEFARCFFRIVNDQDASPCPFDRARWIREVHSELGGLGREALSFVLVVISKYTEERDVQSRKPLEDVGLGDVAGMNDAFDPSLLKERDDSVHVGHLIVGVSDDADPHSGSLSRPTWLDRLSHRGYTPDFVPFRDSWRNMYVEVRRRGRSRDDAM